MTAAIRWFTRPSRATRNKNATNGAPGLTRNKDAPLVGMSPAFVFALTSEDVAIRDACGNETRLSLLDFLVLEGYVLFRRLTANPLV